MMLSINGLKKLSESTQVCSIQASNIASNKSRFLHQALYPDTEVESNSSKVAAVDFDSEAIGLIACNSFEDEARQVLAQIRYFHHHRQAQERITLLCEDRSLVRRLRALLEPYDISLVDPFGWSLITTRAATFLNALLECAEEHFHYTALLELIKSNFAAAVIDLDSVYRFEHDIVRYENIHSDMKQYLHALNKRSQRLGSWTTADKNKLQSSLELIEKACSPLVELFSKPTFSASSITQAIMTTINALDATELLENDSAGKVLLTMLHKMLETSERYPCQLNNSEYKSWLNYELHNHYLINHESNDDVGLVNIKQSQGFTSDYLIVAAANRGKLPNLKNRLQFFNQQVYAALGLSTHQQHTHNHKLWFFELMARSKQCIITWQAEKSGELQLASNWVTAINNLAVKTLGNALPDQRNSIEIPETSIDYQITENPDSVINYEALLGDNLSVSSHQTLIDCPYAFFISNLLGLKSTDEMKDRLQKNDFGSLIHQSLQAFHSGLEYLPGPFEQALNDDTRQAAIELLSKISHKLFKRHIQNTYQDNAWLKQWLRFIPIYIDWEIQQQQQWQATSSEEKYHINISDKMSLTGKIDRVDTSVSNHSEHRLLDYKTGILPSMRDIEQGEHIQLPSYSLFLNNIEEIRYIGLDNKDKVDDGRYIKGEQLNELREQTLARLKTMLTMLYEGKPIPIWPENEKCQQCGIAGICRKGMDS